MDEGFVTGYCVNKSRGGTKCGRWNPTSEQVKVLTELFRAGLRTPSTDQIQKISSQLSFYGKIESKNVFYWFQNHKARERQKRRRVFVEDDDDEHREDHHHHFHHYHKEEKILPSTRHLTERKHEEVVAAAQGAGEREVETLQLFPLNSFSGERVIECENTNKQRLYNNNNNINNKGTSYPCNFGAEMEHPKLDLRLSFL